MTGPSSSAAVWVDAQLPPALAQWLRQMHDVDAWPRVAELLASGEPLIEIGSRV